MDMVGDLKERDHLEDLGVDKRLIKKMDLQEVGWRGKNWIDQLQDRDRWRALVNVTTTSGLHKMRRIS